LSRFVTIPPVGSVGRDVPAGIVVFLVALPLCLGIALASGAPLFSGIIAGVVGGVLISLLSGSELSVSGPAAGLAVIVLASIEQLGSFSTFAVAVVISGLIQLGFGLARAGLLGDFVPNSVIKGMLAAIGVVIVLKQIPHALGNDRDFLGDEAFLQPDEMNTLTEILASLSDPHAGAIAVSALGLAILILWELPFFKERSWSKLLPAPLLCVVAGTLLNEAFGLWLPDWQLSDDRDQLVRLPVTRSVPEFFGMFTPPDWGQALRLDVWVVAGTIAVVGSIETLLCIEATDKLDPEKRISDTNRELRAQGVGNAVSGLLGGLPITSVIVRSSANVYAGARTRLSSFVHGSILMVAAALLPPLLNRLPLASLAAVLLVVGYKLVSRRVLIDMWRQGWTQFVPFAVTLLSIVVTDLLQGIVIGLLSSVFIVMRTNHHAAVTVVESENHWLLRFNKDVSFVNKAELKRYLRDIPDGATVIVDGARALFVDQDIYETLEEFQSGASYRNIGIEYHNVFGKRHSTPGS
jgi:MFS superfamily sulfate permease-like transporter